MALAAPSLVRTTPSVSPASLFEWWHLLSLDAATVAALWCLAFARATGVRLPLLAPLLLGAGTWLIYVADRILDGLRPRTVLRKRHYFYAQHRFAFVLLGLIVSCCVGWLVLTRMQPEVRSEDILLGVAAMFYFALVHLRLAERWMPKELAVGLIFAAATAVPAFARLGPGRLHLLIPVLIFAALCWLNCVAIESWERELNAERRVQHPLPHISTRVAARHLRVLAISLAAVALAVPVSAPVRIVLSFPVAAAACAIFVLDLAAPRLSPLHLRIAADAALLTPLPVLLFFHS